MCKCKIKMQQNLGVCSWKKGLWFGLTKLTALSFFQFGFCIVLFNFWCHLSLHINSMTLQMTYFCAELVQCRDTTQRNILKACRHCRRKARLSLKSETVDVVSPFSATVALLCDSLTFVRQSHFSATVWTGLYILCLLILSCWKMNCEWENVKNCPQKRQTQFFLETEL